MKTVSVHEAKTHLSRYLAEVEQGEEIIIARRDKPVAKLVTIENSRPDRSNLIGCLEGYLAEEVVDYLSEVSMDEEIEADFMSSVSDGLTPKD